MPKTIRNVYDAEVSFKKLLEAHKKQGVEKEKRRK